MKRMASVGIAVGVALLLLIGYEGLAQVQAYEADKLVGKPAPAISLDLLDGGKFNLADHKDKNIVVLDFWATWCPPCRMSMPILVRVLDKYKDKGVVFYAVNEADEPDSIRAFQKKLDLKFAVALDKDKSVARKYALEGIPQTVIVGKDGTVQAVHVGVGPELDKQLTKELDTLIAGKKLAEKPKK